MILKSFDYSLTPTILPLVCSSCHTPIRTSVYWRKRSADQQSPTVPKDTADRVCEACYLRLHYGSKVYYKAPKECILPFSIPPDIAGRMCQCGGGVSRVFPMMRGDYWRHGGNDKAKFGPSHTVSTSCMLVKLGTFIAEAKYATTGGTTSQRKTNKRPALLREFEKQAKEANDKANDVKSLTRLGSAIHRSTSNRKISGVAWSALSNNSDYSSRRLSTATSETSSSTDEAYANESIPVLYKSYARKRPFSKINMALRVGPLQIQNGTSQ